MRVNKYKKFKNLWSHPEQTNALHTFLSDVQSAFDQQQREYCTAVQHHSKLNIEKIVHDITGLNLIVNLCFQSAHRHTNNLRQLSKCHWGWEVGGAPRSHSANVNTM
jgi:hypothetical protein